MSKFESLPLTKLRHILYAKMVDFDREKREYIKRRESGIEKSELIDLVREYIDESEIDKLLLKANPESSSSKKKESKALEAHKSKSSRFDRNGHATQQEPNPDQMRHNASIMRKDPALVRKSNPALANYSNEQLHELADQLDKMAENPEMLKQATEMMKNTTEEDRKKMQESMLSGKGMPDMSGMNEDAQAEHLAKMVKDNPQMFKSMIKSSGMMPGQSDEQINKYVEQLQGMDVSTLKTLMWGTTQGQKYIKPMKEMYDKLDKATYGCAKYIVGFVAMVVLYYLLVLLWYLAKWIWFVLQSVLALVVGSSASKTAPESVADSLNKAASVVSEGSFAKPVADAKAGDEFEF